MAPGPPRGNISTVWVQAYLRSGYLDCAFAQQGSLSPGRFVATMALIVWAVGPAVSLFCRGLGGDCHPQVNCGWFPGPLWLHPFCDPHFCACASPPGFSQALGLIFALPILSTWQHAFVP